MLPAIPPLLASGLSAVFAACQMPEANDSARSSSSSGFTLASTAELGTASRLGSRDSTTRDRSQTSTGSTSTGESGPKITKISEIPRNHHPSTRNPVTIEAVVTATFQDPGQLNGFFIQEEPKDYDQDPQTPEALFVYTASSRVKVKPGDQLRIHGKITQFHGMTQLVATRKHSIEFLARNQPLPPPTPITFPIPVRATDLERAQREIHAYFEAREGMRVYIAQPMSIANIYHLARYGELELVSNGVIRQFTDASPPSRSGYTAHQIDALSRRILWDDDNNRQNSSTLRKGGDKTISHPQPHGFSRDHWVRTGDRVRNLTGVLHWSFSGQPGTDAWRIRSTDETPPNIERTQARPKAPTVQGTLKIAAFNVLNFFSTLDRAKKICGPHQNLDCRGAHSPLELQRQGQKIAAALCALDADIVGLMEIENNSRASLDALITALNRRCPGYNPVYTGTLGSDAIKVGFIYKGTTVSPQGPPQVLSDPSFTDPNNLGRAKNRPALMQTFVERGSKQHISVVVNHLKSKGSSCGRGDDDSKRGAGNCNRTRTLAAEKLTQWLAQNAASKNILILGDLNAYRKEDPLLELAKAGYTDLVARHQGDAYSYVFAGQRGNLDYALANPALATQVRSAAVWHINADESALLDYNDTIQDPGERNWERKSTASSLYRADAYRSSDHDPILVGITLKGAP